MMYRFSRFIFTLVAFCVLPVAQSGAALVWNGLADGDIYNEANWLDDNNLVPADGTINPSSDITAATGGEIIINSGPSPDLFTAGNFQPGVGNNLTIGGGISFTGQLSNRGVSYPGTEIGGNFSVVEGSNVELRFITRAAISLDGGSTITLEGATPINTSTVDFLDTASVFNFNNATFAELEADARPFLTAFTFQGAALEFGADPFALEEGDNALATAFNGADGVSLSAVGAAAIPEPASAMFLLPCVGYLAAKRRRRK